MTAFVGRPWHRSCTSIRVMRLSDSTIMIWQETRPIRSLLPQYIYTVPICYPSARSV